MPHTSPHTANPRLASALAAAARGWPVLPLVPRGKVPAIQGGRGVHDATTDAEQIREWWRSDPERNYGIALGSGLVVLDMDKRHSGHLNLERLEVEHGALPDSVTVETADGRHYYFEAQQVASWEPGPGMELRASGSYVVGPGSIHPTGKRYDFAEGRSPRSVSLAALPDWLRKPDRPSRRQAAGPVDTEDVAKALRAIEALSSYRREDYSQWLKVGQALHSVDDSAEMLETWEEWSRPSDKYEPGACERKWNSFRRDGGLGLGSLIAWARDDSPGFQPTTPTTHEPPGQRVYSLTDMGNGQRMADQHRGTVLYCDPMKCWFYWDSRRWRLDQTCEIDRRAKSTVRQIDREVAEASDPDKRKKLRAWASQSESLRSLRAMIEMCRSEAGIQVEPTNLDRSPWLLTVENGTVNLQTGELRPHRQEDRITKLVPVAYDPEAECPRWLQFLDEVTGGDVELADYLQRAVGYSLTGDTREHKLFFMHGGGRNGKSVFQKIVLKILGDYGQQTPAETLLAGGQKAGRASPELARFKGVRFVSAVEADQNRRLAEALIKQLTGGDTIAARDLFAKMIEFAMEAKLWLASNHKPKVQGQDFALWSRIHLIPFRVRFEGSKQDKQLAAKLEQELPGILAWAIQGTLAWLRDGLQPPDIVLEATQTYQAEQDVLGAFLSERTQSGGSAKKTALWDAYKSWCRDAEEKPLAKASFYESLTERGYEETRTKQSRLFVGLELIEDQTCF